ncbi:glycine N-acyltransferase-like protein 3 [Nasonia vitripennis]|uniref:N-acetyltransferase domain-containing protein n=1 Tax=Nasonia vitripennis TaxID=7425 RepID=A0A7M7QU12_NASVI|nr:glycine N-acyltransferase-like protein 3 [Nasonia vitripennis]XP_032452775.1 glycine N-acyltransferase-like protein 3 [Nasonia vitripennis]XP_032452776.1 glycine N-acyltransferase-like protein 3 [Nasonia vitripennis]XP_032452777.1 glycine N-acyltransferase-like protein 3 [Nasonia vitripennis]
MMDPLQILPMEDWPLLRDTLKRDWPMYAYHYNWVKTAIKWRKKEPELEHEIYCPNGKYDSGVFVGILNSGFFVTTVFAFKESKDVLKQAINETKIIKWDKGVLFNSVHEHFVDVVEEFLDKIKKRKNIQIIKDVTNYFFKSKEDCAKQELPKIPEECEIKHLNLSDIRLIHSIWPHRDLERPETSEKYLENFIRLNRGVGLFLKKNGRLVSWVLYGELGHLGMLQTVDEHKRKGYGKIVTQVLSKELADEEGLDSVLFVVDKNVASEKLFESLNYKRVATTFWFKTEPFTE